MSTKGATTNNATVVGSSLDAFRNRMDGSFLRQCSPEATTSTSSSSTGVLSPNDNRTMRRVKSGHYVLVRPTPLTHPKLIAHSPSVAGLLGIPPSDLSFMDWTKFLSGDVGEDDKTWCTPYALSIMGRCMVSNCRPIPFRRGADGHVMLRSSIREFLASKAMAMLERNLLQQVWFWCGDQLGYRSCQFMIAVLFLD
mmetsp:Transcript_64462/g.75629  ORF Transcript_64462/g.75629 Transcript_64462/m.75629 type:complete len:196 (-) Transcript_64462:290-877(-)